MKSAPLTIFSWFKHKIKSYDMYSKVITFTYKSEDSYRTLIGGVVSIIIFSIISVQAMGLFMIMVDKKASNSTVNTIVTDLSQDTDILNLENTTFQVAVEVTYFINETQVNFRGNDSYLSIGFEQNERILEDGIVAGTSITPINYSICGEDGFKSNFEAIEQKARVHFNYIWPENYNFELQGNYLTDDHKFASIHISKWKNETGSGIVWEDEEAIQQVVNTVFIRIFLVNTYFNFEDYNNPINTFIDERVYRGADGLVTSSYLYFQQNLAKLRDNSINLLSEETRQFLTIETNEKTNVFSSDFDILSISLQKSNKYIIFERKVFNFLDLIGVIGGAFEVLSAFGGLIVFIFSSKFFYYSILSNLYQVDTMDCQKYHTSKLNYRNRSKGIKSLKRLNHNSNHSVTPIDDSEVNYSNINISARSLNTNKRDRFINNMISKTQDSMHSRRVYNFNSKDICYNLFWCFKLKSWF